MFNYISFIGSICSIIALFFVFFPLSEKVKEIEEKAQSISTTLEDVQFELQSDDSRKVLESYFYYIEQNDLEKAYSLFSERKKAESKGGLDGFKGWLENFVAFEGLNISELQNKSSASSKVYLAEFDFKQRGMKPVRSTHGYYMKLIDGRWEIDYSNVLFENGWKEGACEFDSNFEICDQ